MTSSQPLSIHQKEQKRTQSTGMYLLTGAPVSTSAMVIVDVFVFGLIFDDCYDVGFLQNRMQISIFFMREVL
jgi:hypothetical protein